MTTLKEIEAVLYDYATATTGKKWIFASAEEAPPLPYGKIEILSLRQLGTETGTQNEVLADDFKSSADALFLITYQFMMIGDGATQTVLDLMNKSNLQQYSDMLRVGGLGFNTFGGIQDLTGLDFDKVRERAVTEININAVLTAEEVVPFIKTVEVEYIPEN